MSDADAPAALAPEVNQALFGARLPWVQHYRVQALQNFLGWPTPRQEDWKYTNINALSQKNWPQSAAAGTLSTLDLSACLPPQWGGDRLVLIDGHYSPAHSHLGGENQALTIQPLADAIDQPWVQTALAQCPAEHGVHQLNQALMQSGVVIDVPNGFTSQRPVLLLHVNTQTDQAHYLRHLVRLQDQAQLTLVEQYTSLDPAAAYVINIITEVHLARQAQLTHYALQLESASAYHLRTTRCRQDRDSVYRHFEFDWGAKLARQELQCELQESGAACELKGLYMPQGRQHVDNHTRVEHRVPHTSSAQLYKGILTERARAVFNGKVVVHPHAHDTQADQNNHNLLLSSQAEIDTKPELEIYNEAVKCTHGATIGQLDKEALYYMKARGIDAQTARDLLVYGFAEELVASIDWLPIYRLLEQKLLARLPQHECIEGLS